MTFGSSCGRASVTPRGNNTVNNGFNLLLLFVEHTYTPAPAFQLSKSSPATPVHRPALWHDATCHYPPLVILVKNSRQGTNFPFLLSVQVSTPSAAIERSRKYFDFGASWKRSFVQLPFSHHGLADLWSVTIMIVWLGDWTLEYPGKLKWNDVWPITTEKNISSFIAIHSGFAPNRPCRQHMNLESNTESWMWNHTDVLSRREPMKLKQKFYLHEPFLQKSMMQKHALCHIKTLNSNSWFIMFGFRCYWRGMQWTPVAWFII